MKRGPIDTIDETALRALAGVFASVASTATMRALMGELFTRTELHDLALRWKLLQQLEQGIPQRAIAHGLGLSLCKITRGSRILKLENGVTVRALRGEFGKTMRKEEEKGMQVVSPSIQKQMESASWIRKMFEKGLELKKQVGPENVCDFSLGNPDIPPPAKVREALAKVAERAVKPMGLGYCPNAGIPAFREALAGYLAKQQKAPVKAGDIVVTCGAAGALVAFFRAVLDPGDEVICPAPYFVEYGSYCGHFGGVLKPVPSIPPSFQPDLKALEAAVTDRTRVLLVNSPNNPTGCVYSAATMKALAALVDRVNAHRTRPLFLVSDEPYRFLTYGGAVVPAVLPLTPFAVVVGSFSKNLSMAGERVGFMAVSPAMPDAAKLVGAVTMTNRTLGFVNAPVIGQQIAGELLGEGVDLSVYARRREALAAILKAAGIEFTLPEGAFYFFPKAPGGDDNRFVQELLKHNILAVPGLGFGFPGHFRLSFSVADDVIARSAAGFQAAAKMMNVE